MSGWVIALVCIAATILVVYLVAIGFAIWVVRRDSRNSRGEMTWRG